MLPCPWADSRFVSGARSGRLLWLLANTDLFFLLFLIPANDNNSLLPCLKVLLKWKVQRCVSGMSKRNILALFKLTVSLHSILLFLNVFSFLSQNALPDLTEIGQQFYSHRNYIFWWIHYLLKIIHPAPVHMALCISLTIMILNPALN